MAPDDLVSQALNGQDDEPMPTVRCGICGTVHTAPECKWNDAEVDDDVRF